MGVSGCAAEEDNVAVEDVGLEAVVAFPIRKLISEDVEWAHQMVGFVDDLDYVFCEGGVISETGDESRFGIHVERCLGVNRGSCRRV
jgi:hypothetical protein